MRDMIKIVHLCLNSAFTYSNGYQDMMLAKCHAKEGHEVTLIASSISLDNKKKQYLDKSCDYITTDNVRLIRIHRKRLFFLKIEEFLAPYDILPLLRKIKPDLIMIHGLVGSVSAYDVRKYVMRYNINCTVVADIHNGMYLERHIQNTLKGKILNLVRHIMNKQMFLIYKKIYGVTPDCIKYATLSYGAPEKKLELLPLGFDTDMLEMKDKNAIYNSKRNEMGFLFKDIVTAHGGTICKERKTIELIKAFSLLNDKRLKLVIFGDICDDVKEEFTKLVEENSDFVTYLGFLDKSGYYDLYLASDIAIFPGRQSVLWQEAIGCRLPLAIGYSEMIEYLDIGGNLHIFKNTSTDGLLDDLKKIFQNGKFEQMKSFAKMADITFFSYREIAKKLLNVR
jgi:hypothetical protein